MSEAVEALVDLLTWGDRGRVEEEVEVAKRRHVLFLTRRLTGYARADGTGEGDAVLDSIMALPSEGVQRILGAPETCHGIYGAADHGCGALWAFLRDVVLAENLAAGSPRPLDRPIWSALGDLRYTPAGPAEEDPGVHRFRAPRFNGIVIDTESPYAKQDIIASDFRPAFGAYAPFTETERDDVLFKCYAAIGTLAAEDKAPWIFVKGLVATVMPRKDTRNETFKGSSNLGIMGRANLINPHLPEVDHAMVATSLLHEAVHMYLYLLEEQDLLIGNEDIAFNARLRSPWSGNMINPRAYVHGSFVWYGLYNFWLARDNPDTYSPWVRDYFLDFCARGYRDGVAVERLEAFRGDIRADVFSAVEYMQDRMADAHAIAH